MVIKAVVVLYNPKDEFLDRYKEMAPFFDEIYFIDNSTSPNEKLNEELKKIKNIRYLSLGRNKGISYALKEGMDQATTTEADYVLTMDQDSRFPVEDMEEVRKILADNIDSQYGIISVNYNSEETTKEIREVPWWITSGNFVNVKAYKSLEQGFNPDLFIDGVDQDLCHSFIKSGYKIGLIPGINLKHQIGNPVYHRILWKKFSTFNYPLFRYYYLFRNYYYLHKKDPKYYKKEFFKIKYLQPFKILFYEDNKKAKFRAAKLGKKDAKKGILGPCQHQL